MKRLVSAKDVIAAAARHEDIYVDENTIVTAQAKDVARENGVHITCGPKPEEHAVKEHAACEKGAADHAAVECHKVDLTHEGKGAEPALTAAELEHLIAAAFEKGIWTKDDIETLLGKKESAIDPNVVPVGVSGRHIHLSQHDLETLFGKGYELTKVKDLSQPGQFAAKECVTLAGPKGVIQKVRVLGPVRSQTQVEVLAGDTFKLGVPQEIRLSGHLEGTPGITVIGPKGTVVLPEGVMVAARHIHMSPSQAAERGFHDGQVVSLKICGERGGMLDNVIVRVTETGNLDCHIDTEEANAFHLKTGSKVQVVR
ncbi:phosphate propanoyltransferase [Parafannyhessea umbonata]|uniref:phosphate propanoyltransferase n=1 Tax=Parafannyhessea TaxID=2847312 RepID=UPI002A80CA35|nr:phosphate propanoyltransferase [Parafannyhessea umbonata]MDY4418983.1 phosphate propanoyltransferase [Parafannyhessea umbonata]